MTSVRRREVGVSGKAVALPSFFPSVSSVKTRLAPVECVDLLALSRRPRFLVSAYDVAHCTRGERYRMDAALLRAQECGSVILMDSGNYESYWKADQTWDARRFHQIAESAAYDICFCYDNQSPPCGSARAIADDVIARVLDDQRYAVGTVAPIVHGQAQLLPEAVGLVAEELCPIIVAVPERELGEGIVERMRTVRRIRKSLDRGGRWVALHLLGTGTPLSMVVYGLAGADMYDGLEWCRTVVDHNSGSLHHFHHWDLFREQTVWGQEQSLPYVQSTLMHNLWFYEEFERDLQEAVNKVELERMLRRFSTDAEAAMLMGALDA